MTAEARTAQRIAQNRSIDRRVELHKSVTQQFDQKKVNRQIGRILHEFLTEMPEEHRAPIMKHFVPDCTTKVLSRFSSLTLEQLSHILVSR